MGEIRFISTATVAQRRKPNESTQRIDLNPWELRYLLFVPIQKGVLFRKPTQDQQMTNIIHHLKTSLERTLDLFYPLAGRLVTTVNGDDDTTCFFIDCNGAGVPFIHASADGVTVGDILDPVYVPRIVYSFFPLNETRNYHGVSEPLLAVQVTELEDGIFIGCTMNHVVADGTSFWHFFNSWSEISRGSDINISQSPVFERGFVPEANFPVRIPQSELVFGGFPSSSPTQERVFHFRKEKIAALKAKANAEKGTNQISSLQALLAHLWQSVTRNRRLREDEETVHAIPVGMRPRIDPPLPQQYLGAAIQGWRVKMKAGELLELSLGHTAWQINQMISTFIHISATNFFESWAKNPKPISPVILTIGNVLLMRNSPRFNVYGTDFGWGRPVAFRSGGGNKFDGMITIFEGSEEGSIDIEACLSPATLESMVDDAEFMDVVSI